MAIQTLQLADDLFASMHAGSKRVTIRKGYRQIVPGPLRFDAADGTVESVQVEVTEVRFKRMPELTDAEAQADGFRGRDEVIPLMRRFYPDFNQDSEITLIYFRV